MKFNTQNLSTKYSESGKIDFGRLILFLIIGYIISGLAGIGYGLLSDVNPLIYLNFILLAICVVIIYFTASLLKSSGKLRNRYVAMIIAVFFGFICAYNAWSSIYANYDQSVFGGLFFQHSMNELTNQITSRNLSIGRLGRNGSGLGSEVTSIIYLVEFLILIVVPAYITVKDPSYYCEECDKSMDEKEYYFMLTGEESANFKEDVKNGKLSELFKLISFSEKSLSIKDTYIHCKAQSCPNCNELVYTAELGHAKMEKNDTSFKSTEKLAVNLYGNIDK